MEFTEQFRVRADLQRTYKTLTDLAAIAPCVSGAEVVDVTDDTAIGSLNVQVGPLTVRYEGTAARVGQALDESAGSGEVKLHVAGDESPGSGSATVDLTATLSADGADTDVTIDTVVEVTGKPAQFGKAVVGDVVSRMATDFGQRLTEQLAEVEPEPAPASEAASAPDSDTASEAGPASDPGPASDAEAASDPEPAFDPEPASDPGTASDAWPASAAGPGSTDAAIDLPVERETGPDDVWELSGRSRADDIKRFAPMLALVAVGAGVFWWLRRR